MKITIYYQNEITRSWKGFEVNQNGSITINCISDIVLSDNAIRHNTSVTENPFSWVGIIEIKGKIKKGIWFPIEHQKGNSTNLASSTYVLWD